MLSWTCLQSALVAEVAILANRTKAQITVEIVLAAQPLMTLTIPAAELRPVFFEHSAEVRFGTQFAPRSFRLDSGSAYFFRLSSDNQGLDLEKIGLGQSDLIAKAPAPLVPGSVAKATTASIPVLLAVDENEPTHRSIWEARLRTRLQAASEVLEQNCGAKFKVVGIQTWNSDEHIRDFCLSLLEFEREVPPGSAQLVIGFSSQYEIATGRIHLGGSRGTLVPHILLKERAIQVHEPERLELLVHELGHFLGAAHSPEPDSVMRPLLTAGPLRAARARIRFDPVNALLMSLLVDEMRVKPIRHCGDVTFPTKQRMAEIYEVLQAALPNDPAAAQLQQLVGNSHSRDLVQDVREVLRQLTRFAKLEQGRRQAADAEAHGVDTLEPAGDDLTSKYVREAAAISAEFDSPDAAKAMILALGIFVDDGATLRTFPATKTFVLQAEAESEREARLQVLGEPTMRGRSDLVRHFFVSGHLLLTMGSAATRGIGIAKEVIDSNGGSGFSFADMAANRAGIAFAEKTVEGKFPLDQLARGFSVDKFLPEVADLEEGLSSEKFRASFGGTDTAAFDAQMEQIEQRILDLPVYRVAPVQ